MPSPEDRGSASAHAVVKLALIPTVRLGLSRIATHSDEVKLPAQRKESIVLAMHIVDQLPAHTEANHASTQ